MPNNIEKPSTDMARRHVLKLAAATSAKVVAVSSLATVALPGSADAFGRMFPHRGGKGGKGGHGGLSGGGSNGGGSYGGGSYGGGLRWRQLWRRLGWQRFQRRLRFRPYWRGRLAELLP